MKLSPTEFFDKYSTVAVNDSVYSGVPASIKLAQAALESGWGGSSLTENANNFFGIKTYGGWTGPAYSAQTYEYYDNSGPTQIQAAFRAYPNAYASFMDHTQFLKENSNYRDLFQLDPLDYKGWAYGLKAAGYATSPTYAEKLINLIEKYDLSRYDRKAENRRTIKNIIWFLFILSLIITIIALIRKFR